MLPSHVTSSAATEQQTVSERAEEEPQVELTGRQKDAIRIATTTKRNMFITGPGGSVGCMWMFAADTVLLKHMFFYGDSKSIPQLPGVGGSFLVQQRVFSLTIPCCT
jgi:hypothetical protein